MTDPITEAVARAMFDWSHDEGWERGELATKRIYMEDARVAIRALYGALEKEGWQVVPREPTQQMQIEGDSALSSEMARDRSEAKYVYTSILCAAPKPPGAG